MLLEKDGKYSISASFYRMMDFDAPMVGTNATNGGLVFQSEDELFKANLLIYHDLTASGESYFDSEYKLSFVNLEMTIVLKDDSVIAMSGCKYTFILNDERWIYYHVVPIS